jgi:hypothetical protein
MQPPIIRLLELGPLPPEEITSSVALIAEYEHLLHSITTPVSDAEARILVSLYSPETDTCFGLSWTMIYFIESSPNWPLLDLIAPPHQNVWTELLYIRHLNHLKDIQGLDKDSK